MPSTVERTCMYICTYHNASHSCSGWLRFHRKNTYYMHVECVKLCRYRAIWHSSGASHLVHTAVGRTSWKSDADTLAETGDTWKNCGCVYSVFVFGRSWRCNPRSWPLRSHIIWWSITSCHCTPAEIMPEGKLGAVTKLHCCVTEQNRSCSVAMYNAVVVFEAWLICDIHESRLISSWAARSTASGGFWSDFHFER